jgi:hypothetical protein
MAMRVRSHTSSWRLAVSALPLLGVAFLVFAVTQGEGEVARSGTVYLVIAALSVPATFVPWRLVQRMDRTPVVPLARAQPGYVALRGRAEPLPGVPLRSPDGSDCVWYAHREGRTGSRTSPYLAEDSSRPFLLVDGAHRCVVDPTGAEISGAHPAPGGGTRERLIVAGDPLFVAGRLLRSASELARPQGPEGDRDGGERGPALPSLPAVCAPGGLSPFLVTVGEGDLGLYRLAWCLNAVLGIGAAIAYAWLAHARP